MGIKQNPESIEADLDDVEIGEPESWGHNPLDEQEIAAFDRLLYMYGIQDERQGERDRLLDLWSAGKTELMQVLGGHTLQAEITCADVDRANELLNAEYYRSIWSVVRLWWEQLPYLTLDSYRKSYDRPDTEQLLMNRLSPTGEKLSKRIAKDLEPFKRERFLKSHSELIAKCRAKGFIRLSVSPIELLMISENATFTSCHSLIGCYAAGNFGYLIDKHTIVMYYWSDQGYSNILQRDFPCKKWRQLLYADVPNRSAIISRHYPGSRDILAKAARQLFFRKLASYWNIASNRLIALERSGEREFCSKGTAYLDWEYFRVVFLKDGGSDPDILIPEDPVLLPKNYCQRCYRRCDRYDLKDTADGLVCPSCYSQYFICRSCKRLYRLEKAHSFPEGQYCSNCICQCRRCGHNYPRDYMDYLGWGTLLYCPTCLSILRNEEEQ